jgi:hypothetical protein
VQHEVQNLDELTDYQTDKQKDTRTAKMRDELTDYQTDKQKDTRTAKMR